MVTNEIYQYQVQNKKKSISGPTHYGRSLEPNAPGSQQDQRHNINHGSGVLTHYNAPNLPNLQLQRDQRRSGNTTGLQVNTSTQFQHPTYGPKIHQSHCPSSRSRYMEWSQHCHNSGGNIGFNPSSNVPPLGGTYGRRELTYATPPPPPFWGGVYCPQGHLNTFLQALSFLQLQFLAGKLQFLARILQFLAGITNYNFLQE